MEIYNEIQWSEIRGPMTRGEAELLEIDGWRLATREELRCRPSFALDDKCYWATPIASVESEIEVASMDLDAVEESEIEDEDEDYSDYPSLAGAYCVFVRVAKLQRTLRGRSSS